MPNKADDACGDALALHIVPFALNARERPMVIKHLDWLCERCGSHSVEQKPHCPCFRDPVLVEQTWYIKMCIFSQA
jgi:hypothetical protein